MTDFLDKRVTELESVIWDVANPMNMRFTRFDMEFAAMRGTMETLERAMAALQVDMRDVRGGITHHLVAPEGQLREIKADIAAMKTVINAITADLREVLRRLPNA